MNVKWFKTRLRRSTHAQAVSSTSLRWTSSFLPMRCRTYKNTDLTVSHDGTEPYSNRFLRISSLAGRTKTGLWSWQAIRRNHSQRRRPQMADLRRTRSASQVSLSCYSTKRAIHTDCIQPWRRESHFSPCLLRLYIFTAMLGEAGHFSRRAWRKVERVRCN